MLKLYTAPTKEPISITEANEHLRLDTDDDFGLVTGLIKVARQYCEDFQNRAYFTQTWELWLDAFPWELSLDIPRPPLASISSIKYYDTANTEYTLAATEYFVDTKSTPGRVALAYGKSWPSTTLRPANGVCITFVAGETTLAAISQEVKQAILLLIGHWYEHREGATEKPLSNVPTAIESLLWINRVF